MKITFLGTSHGVPARGRNCSCAMIEIGETIYFIDGGAPMIEEFLKYKTEEDLKRVRAVFTTHSHGDHVYGIMHMMSLMNWYYKLPFNVYFTHEGMIEASKMLYTAAGGGSGKMDPDRIKFYIEDPDVGYEDENVKLTFIPTAHMYSVNSPSYAILVEAEGKRVLFSGDLSVSLGDMPKIVTTEHLDLFVCEMAHFGFEALKPTLDACLADKVYINHIWKPVKFDEIRNAAKDYTFDLRTLDDGDVVEL